MRIGDLLPVQHFNQVAEIIRPEHSAFHRQNVPGSDFEESLSV
jgi:hypothetical protein